MDKLAGEAASPASASVVFAGQSGTLHQPPSAAARGLAVLVCGPVGREARCAYRPLHLWCERLARDGFTVLRYDHPGEGDSLALPTEADQWQAWLVGVRQAAAFLRRHSGAERLVVCGLRIGAALALSAAETLRPDGLVLLAPIITGESWLRDLRLACAVQGAPPSTNGGLEVDGLKLGPKSLKSLRRLDLLDLPSPAAPTFVAGSPGSRRLAERLGSGTVWRSFEGYARLFKDAHLNAPPRLVFDAATDWLRRLALDAPPVVATPPVLPAPILTGRGWREAHLTFGHGLRGVLCESDLAAPGRRAVIIGNTAADPRAGIGSFAAKAARALAAQGLPVLRFDFAGLGESAPSDGDWRSHIYETPRLTDFQAAAAHLRKRGYSEFVLLGVCTGGFHAIQAALASDQFQHAIAINSWLVWRPDSMPLEMRSQVSQAQRADSARPPGASRLGRWRAGAARRLRSVASASLPDKACQAFRRQVRQAGARRPRIQLLYGRADLAMRWLEADFGPGGAWLRRHGIQVRLRPGLDHALFSESSQTQALKELCELLGLTPPASSRRWPRGTAETQAPRPPHTELAPDAGGGLSAPALQAAPNG